MPRRKVEQAPLDEPILALPPPRVIGKGHGHAHERDPYETPAGAVPAKVSNVQTTRQPLKRKQTEADALAREQAKTEQRVRASRYRAYLDEMVTNGGDKLASLAIVYDLPIDAVRDRFDELHADVRSGVGSTDLADVLEKSDLALTDRVGILKKHAYSDNPAASLKAVDMIQDLEGTGGGQGSFESFLRLAKEQRRK